MKRFLPPSRFCIIIIIFAYLLHLKYSDHQTKYLLHQDNESKYKMQFLNDDLI